MKSFAHCGSVNENSLKFLILSSIDVIAIFCIILFRRCFVNRLNYIAYLSYQIGVLIIDSSLFGKTINANIKIIILDKLIEIVMFCILALTILKIILSIYRSGK